MQLQNGRPANTAGRLDKEMHLAVAVDGVDLTVVVEGDKFLPASDARQQTF